MTTDQIEVTLIAETGIIALLMCVQLVVLLAIWYILRDMRDKRRGR